MKFLYILKKADLIFHKQTNEIRTVRARKTN